MQNYFSEFNCNRTIELKRKNWLLNRLNKQFKFLIKKFPEKQF